ncbi:MAG: hypothetical protein V9E96_18360 [Chitinophagaceae bacterium]
MFVTNLHKIYFDGQYVEKLREACVLPTILGSSLKIVPCFTMPIFSFFPLFKKEWATKIKEKKGLFKE